MRYQKEEHREHGKPIQAKAQGELRSFGEVGEDRPDCVRRAGGEDPRRYEAKIAIDRVVTNHDQSGYNHAYTPGADSYARAEEKKAMGMGTPHPDGTYSR